MPLNSNSEELIPTQCPMEIENLSEGGFTDLIDLVGREEAQSIFIYDAMGLGCLLTDHLSNVLWTSPKFQKNTLFSLHQTQELGLNTFVPKKYHSMHPGWVAGFHQPFKPMSAKKIPVPMANDQIFQADIHIRSWAGALHGEPTGFRLAILNRPEIDAEQDFISKRIINLGEAINKIGRPTILLLIGLIFAWVLASNSGRLIRIWEDSVRQDMRSQGNGSYLR